MIPDVFIRLVDFPATVNAVIVPNCDDTYNIYVNSRLSEDEQRIALEHELYHLRREHLWSKISVHNCEMSANDHTHFVFGA